jgi:peroxiredoxin Q/BCP
MLKPGDPAPDFATTDERGNVVRLADFRGKTVVLWFYPKADTPGCTREGCAFRDLAAEFAAKDAVILGVSFDSPEENRSFAQKFGFKFPLLCDVDRELGLAYGACETPEEGYARRIGVVIDPDGIVRHYDAKVDAGRYPAEVLARL